MISLLLKQDLIKLKEQGLHRQRRLAPCRKENQYLNFSSNDYLSLTENSLVKKAFATGFAHYPSGSGGSMVVCGYHSIHQQLEQTFAEALAVDDALLFSSGYAANLAISALLSRFKIQPLIDKALHASFYDGFAATGIQYTRYLHNNLSDLESKLATKQSPSLVITEGLFSMSGQISDLKKTAQLCIQAQAELVVDEAHSFGILGREGLGAVVFHELTQQQVPLRVIPLGKAFAAQGAMVVGQGEWIDALLQTARSHIYSTAVSPAFAAGLLETFAIVRQAEEQRQKLGQLVDYFQRATQASSLTWRESTTPIQQLQLGCPHQALHYSNALYRQGIFCQALRAPTVSRKETGLRVILNADHEAADIDRLFTELEQIDEIRANS